MIITDENKLIFMGESHVTLSSSKDEECEHIDKPTAIAAL